MAKDSIRIIVSNSFGDEQTKELENPTLDELLSSFVQTANLLGYSGQMVSRTISFSLQEK